MASPVRAARVPPYRAAGSQNPQLRGNVRLCAPFTHADFGPSEFGRQRYDFTSARNQRELGHFRRWDALTGRRIDLLMRHLPIAPNQSVDDTVAALRAWLAAGAASRVRNPPSSWHLARKAMILIDPVDGRGDVVWPLAELDRPELR